jgi:hypothetical protein
MRLFAHLLVVIITVTWLAAAPPAPRPEYDVRMPVVYGGIRYEPAAFNATGLQRRVHYVVLAARPDVLYAFLSIGEVKQFIANAPSRSTTGAGGKLASPLSSPLAYHGCAYHNSEQFGWFYLDYLCAPEPHLGIHYAVGIPDLAVYGFNDNITSMSCAPYSFYVTWCVLWENTNYGGASLWVQAGNYYSDLGVASFNNRASSIIVYGQPT